MYPKKISPEQIAQLKEFLNKKRVRYYDLQLELLDHLATSIEQTWEENPDMPFQQALDRVYSGFGVTGFSRIVAQRETALQKRVFLWAWAFVKAWLRFPRILLTLLTIASFTQLILWVEDPTVVFAGSMIVAAAIGVTFLTIHLRFWRKRKKFLVVQAALSLGSTFAGLLYTLMYLLPELLIELGLFLPAVAPLYSTYLFGLFLFLYAIYIEVPRRASEQVQKEFPEYAR